MGKWGPKVSSDSEPPSPTLSRTFTRQSSLTKIGFMFNSALNSSKNKYQGMFSNQFIDFFSTLDRTVWLYTSVAVALLI